MMGGIDDELDKQDCLEYNNSYPDDPLNNPPSIISGHVNNHQNQEPPSAEAIGPSGSGTNGNHFKTRTLSSTGKIKPQLQSVRELGGEDNEATIEDEDLADQSINKYIN